MLIERPSPALFASTIRAICIQLIVALILLLAAIVPPTVQAAPGVAGTPMSKLSGDFALHTVGDATGFHLLLARKREHYAWKTVATLREPGLETDRWIGNACVTGSGRRAVVVYAPRQFTNQALLFDRGAYTAVVDLLTGRVIKLAVRSTLAYFSPGCGSRETAILTQTRTNAPRSKAAAATRLIAVDATTANTRPPIELDGQITSAIPTRRGVLAASGKTLVRVGRRNAVRTLATTTSVPFRLVADSTGAVTYMDHSRGIAHVRRLAAYQAQGAAGREIASGPLADVNISPSTLGRAWITGSAQLTGRLPRSLRRVDVPRHAELSTDANLAILHDDRAPVARGAVARAANARAPREDAAPITLRTRVLSSGITRRVVVRPGARTIGHISQGAQPAPAPLNGPQARAAAVTSPTDPTDPNRTCSVARNDPRTQVYQPTPRQVEWAANQAVVGKLTMARPANWKQSGLASWRPQTMFPSRALNGGGRVNTQILLGILAQESNLWQASGHALSGETGNPLIGNFYGRPIYDANTDNDWDIDFSKADCGYGVSQITDGMRRAGSERPNEKALPADKQRAAAVDYATNIAAGLQILQDKWNQTHSAGLIHSDGDPANIENWIFAVWAYNSGFYAKNASNPSAPWGVGWANNPANPIYPANRTFFNRNPADAAHPQHWPYPEKVIGFATYSIDTPDGPGFRPAWWTTDADRLAAKPPIYTFCTAANTCEPGARHLPTDPAVAGSPPGPCAHRNSSGQYDLRCWWNSRVTYNDCYRNHCGNELLRFDATYPEQPDGTHYPPSCSLNGLPAGALVIDNQPASTPAVRAGCGHPWTDAGSFALRFADDAAKVDFHQIGGGLGGHFWFAHTRQATGRDARMTVTGTWTFNRPVTTWGRVLVHMPDHGAHTQQARYVISLGDGTTKTRYALQQTLAHRWVSLGVMKFNGTPRITLASTTDDGAERDDIAWDAVAIQQLPAKPRDFVVALGDSYSAGEGASEPDGGDDYYRETDTNGELGDKEGRNACHRSPHAWSRQATLASSPSRTIGTRADSWDTSIDFQFHACAGARTFNLLPELTAPAGPKPRNPFGRDADGQYGEVSQLDKGYLDENTTHVTLSVGGNDARFVDIIKQCIYEAGLYDCQETRFTGDSEPLKTTVPRNISGPVKTAIMQVLTEIRRRAPNARIVLMGYPRLLNNQGACMAGINPSEGAWIDDMADEMATTMSEVASAASAQGIPTWFSDPRDEFDGKGICGDPATIHGIVTNTTAGDKPKNLLQLPPSQQSFHPKISGATLYAASLNETLRRMGQ